HVVRSRAPGTTQGCSRARPGRDAWPAPGCLTRRPRLRRRRPRAARRRSLSRLAPRALPGTSDSGTADESPAPPGGVQAHRRWPARSTGPAAVLLSAEARMAGEGRHDSCKRIGAVHDRFDLVADLHRALQAGPFERDAPAAVLASQAQCGALRVELAVASSEEG